MTASFLDLTDCGAQGIIVDKALADPSMVADFLAVEGNRLVYRWGRPLHHAFLPLAVAAGTWIDRPLARRVFARVTLPTMLARVPNTDIDERRAIAAVGGIAATGYSDASLFGGIVRQQADRLHGAFTVAASPPGHQGVRPRAIARKDWAALPTADRVMVATIIGLFSGDGGRHLMPGLRLPSAVDAVATMLDADDDDLRTDFFGLLAYYPGW